MPLEDLTCIDLVLKPGEDGKVGLVITDAGITTDPEQRYELFLKKVQGYVSCILSGQFDSTDPGRKPSDFYILLTSVNPATPQMQLIKAVTPRGRPQDAIEVRFEVWPAKDEVPLEAPIADWLKSWIDYAIERALFEINSK